MNIDLSIIIVSFNTEKITIGCIDSIYKSKTKFSYEVIVVDNNSADNTVSNLKQLFPSVILIESKKNNGFSKGNNMGIAIAKGKYLLLLNSDTILFEDSIETLMNSTTVNNYDITGPILLNSDNTIQRSWFNFPSVLKVFLRLMGVHMLFFKFSNSFFFRLLFAKRKPAFMMNEITKNTKMNYLSFACVLIKREVIEKIGNLDEHLVFYHEDCEYGIRANKNNYDVVYCVDSKIIHLGGTSSGNFSSFLFENDIKGLLHVYKKHYSTAALRNLKITIYMALSWRIFFWNFGLYKHIRKISLYEDSERKSQKVDEIELYNKYKELRKLTSAY